MKIKFGSYRFIALGISVIVLAVIYSFQFVTPLVRDALSAETNYKELAARIEAQINENVGKNGYLVESYVQLEGRSLRIIYQYDRPCSQRSPGLGLLRKEVYLNLDELSPDIRLSDSYLTQEQSVLRFRFEQETENSLRQLSELTSAYVINNSAQGTIERLEKISQIQVDFLEERSIKSSAHTNLCGGFNFSRSPITDGESILLNRGDYLELKDNLSKYIKYINSTTQI